MTLGQLFSESDRWIKHHGWARRLGNGFLSFSVNRLQADCFCLSGAVQRCYPELQWEEIFKKLTVAIERNFGHRDYEETGMGVIPEFNDDPLTSFEDILLVVGEANV